MQTMLHNFTPTKQHGRLVKEFPADGFSIYLFQNTTRKHNSFAVQYGMQLDYNLTYGEACDKLGEAIMHNLSCLGYVDNERD